MMERSWSLEGWLTPEGITRVLPWVKYAFWGLLLALVVILLVRSVTGRSQKAISRAYRVFFWLVALLFAGLLTYQATWQLAGFVRPEFVTFMKRYNRRPDNPAANLLRGSILDVRGRTLATTDPDVPGRRWYPGGAPFFHIIGYEHPVYGMSGVEAADHPRLSGMTRDTTPEWEKFRRNLLTRAEIEGTDRVLTLDATLQRKAHALMKGRRGAVVAIDPSDGAVLVLYSSPSLNPEKLDPAVFTRKDADASLLNRALQGLYPPGSTFKVLIAAAALERGVNPQIDCPADGYRFGTGNKPIRDHEFYDYQRNGRVWPGHGRIGMREAMAKSSNVYFAKLGTQIGGESVYGMAVKCGFTRPWLVFEGSAADLSSAAARFPALTDRDVAKTAQISIGQGDMLATPLHMAVLAGAIGRQGVVWSPRLAADQPPVPQEAMFSADTAKALTAMMRHTVLQGTGRAADIEGLSVAGKTGTAQNPHGDDHSWFIGFAPSVNPRIAFAVIVENGGYGSRAAVPVAAELLKVAQVDGYFTRAAGAVPAGGVP